MFVHGHTPRPLAAHRLLKMENQQCIYPKCAGKRCRPTSRFCIVHEGIVRPLYERYKKKTDQLLKDTPDLLVDDSDIRVKRKLGKVNDLVNIEHLYNVWRKRFVNIQSIMNERERFTNKYVDIMYQDNGHRIFHELLQEQLDKAENVLIDILRRKRQLVESKTLEELSKKSVQSVEPTDESVEQSVEPNGLDTNIAVAKKLKRKQLQKLVQQDLQEFIDDAKVQWTGYKEQFSTVFETIWSKCKMQLQLCDNELNKKVAEKGLDDIEIVLDPLTEASVIMLAIILACNIFMSLSIFYLEQICTPKEHVQRLNWKAVLEECARIRTLACIRLCDSYNIDSIEHDYICSEGDYLRDLLWSCEFSSEHLACLNELTHIEPFDEYLNNPSLILILVHLQTFAGINGFAVNFECDLEKCQYDRMANKILDLGRKKGYTVKNMHSSIRHRKRNANGRKNPCSELCTCIIE